MRQTTTHISVRGACEHNLRNIDLDLPHDQLVVFTGVSGSGKSSLIYETLFRESQRRHVASLPLHLRALFGGLTRPKADTLDGLRPAIAVQRTGLRSGRRGTVGAITEVLDFLAVLFARAGEGLEADDVDPRVFLPTSHRGACPACGGTGTRDEVDLGALLPDPRRSISEGAIASTTPTGYVRYSRLTRPGWLVLASVLGFSLDTPWEALTPEQRDAVLYGSPGLRQASSLLSDFGGIVPTIQAAYRRSPTGLTRRFVRTVTCQDCLGTRLNPEALRVRLGGRTMAELQGLTVDACQEFLAGVHFDGSRRRIAEAILPEISLRLGLLVELGLGYLHLDRPVDTLSGGEAQRVRLASQVSSGISGVLYVLDEPSVGLHARDHNRLLGVLRRLRDLGNTLCVAEHDRSTILAADYVVDMGPGPADRGGRVVASGPPSAIAESPESITGAYLRGARTAIRLGPRRPAVGPAITIRGARFRNLKNLDVRIPLGALVCVTGVSGSGKSTLVHGILRPALSRLLTQGRSSRPVGDHDAVEGAEQIARVIEIDQQPIGRSPRSNPATYTRAFDHIRNAFAKMPEAQVRGFGLSHFSFNVAGGRCEACSGAGVIRVPMQLVPDVFVECEECGGKRFSRDVLRVRYRGVSISQVLEMTAEAARELFSSIPAVERAMSALCEVGLDYIRLGQPATSLSGGEAQRVKLAAHVAKPRMGHTLYLLDEPTTGLHFADIDRLLHLLGRLVDEGNTVLVIEHNPDVIRSADWVIDLGPEGGDGGGEIVAEGTPEDLQALGRRGDCRSWTARLLASPDDCIADAPGPRMWPAGGRQRQLCVRGARANNLQAIDVDIPKAAITCVTGPSGSGKSSLVFDTIYAACQNTFAQCLSSYARQALGGMRALDATSVTGVSPAVAVDRRSRVASSRSMVGTATEVLQLLRVLWARVGVRHCPQCGEAVRPLTADAIADRIAADAGGRMIQLVAPVARGARRRREVAELVADLVAGGLVRVRLNGRVFNLSVEELDFGTKRRHDVDCIVDRLKPSRERLDRLAESVRLALDLGAGGLVCEFMDGEGLGPATTYSSRIQCAQCRASLEPELTARHLSFGHPLGQCPQCRGTGTVRAFDPGSIVPDPSRSFARGAIAPLTRAQYADPRSDWSRAFAALGRSFGFDRNTPFADLDARQLRVVLYGAGDRRLSIHVNGPSGSVVRRTWKGLIPILEGAIRRDPRKAKGLARYQADVRCSACDGERLMPEFRAVRVGGRRLPELVEMTVDEALEFVSTLTLPDAQQQTASGLLSELRGRLRFMQGVGLGYATLSRGMGTLSAGESQRVRLAAQLGGTLSGLLYVLDEPSVGLHPHDMVSLVFALEELRELGNTVIAVEHDEAMMAHADYLVDMGPGPGRLGGRVMAAGPRDDVLPAVLAARPALRSGSCVPASRQRCIRLTGVRHHNLRNVTVHVPIGALTCVTGVSGSGKSSLVFDVLRAALRRRLQGHGPAPGEHDSIEGLAAIDHVIVVTQAALGQSMRSVPATYVGFFDAVRGLFASLPESRARGLTRAHFSFNDAKGRCRACQGDGYRQVDLQLMADLTFVCEQCQGRRYQDEVLTVTYQGKSIADVLALTFDEAAVLFQGVPEIEAPIAAVCRAGLGYVVLGQPSPTLSGGESQRLRLATALVRPSSGHGLYLMDEPTTGLHARDVAVLHRVLRQLVDSGATVVIIEHNLDMIAAADHVIDLGPGGGPNGGRLLVEGPPEAVMGCRESVTGMYLRTHVGHTAEGVRNGSPSRRRSSSRREGTAGEG
ncbi:MAG TPA: excinuclease ABC subunit UvrA [Armatimonadota bacterium]|nr:excinuclease ABC subunit UvrA [Armatimonadota bacterium]